MRLLVMIRVIVIMRTVIPLVLMTVAFFPPAMAVGVAVFMSMLMTVEMLVFMAVHLAAMIMQVLMVMFVLVFVFMLMLMIAFHGFSLLSLSFQFASKLSVFRMFQEPGSRRNHNQTSR